ncbi:HAD hydrolase-like protein [Piscibacillus salipiscarius]|uniref:HAD hydrolase-like protein n=1 Tax=Piscibacillus salipiscarius TaxID=299480 RepID=UPI003F70C455
MIKAIIFDFDGTLADTLPVCYYAFQAIFKEFDNVELTSEEIKVCLVHLKRESLERILLIQIMTKQLSSIMKNTVKNITNLSLRMKRYNCCYIN